MFSQLFRAFRTLIFTVGILIAASDICISSEAAALYADSLKTYQNREISADADSWSFIFLGDSHTNYRKLKEILQRAAEINPLFILHGGDISDSGSAQEMLQFLEVVKSVKNLPPLFVVRGNHEMNSALFEKMIGPRNFVIDSQRLGLHLVAVDNSSYALSSNELSFLSKNLDQKRLNQFVAMHIPPKTERWPKHTFEIGKNELLTLITERNVRMGLFSHNHLFDTDIVKGTPYIISSGAGGQLAWFGYAGEVIYHFVVVEVINGKLSHQIERFETELMP